MFVMWIGGLRGAMAYALAIQAILDYGDKGRIMLFTTIVFTLITILLVGSCLYPILVRCDVIRKPDDG
jgi:NhaP-type Na+/H+ or K+/H+ antiporter